MLEVRQLSKSFGSRVALTQVSLAVARGEILALLGPSGSGKSTLLRVIAGLESANSGEIFWQNRPIHGLPAHERQMALISQRPALTPGQTVAESLAQGLVFAESRLPRKERQSTAEIEARVQDTAKLVELSHALSQPVETLSSGEQQRVAFGRAIVRRAPIWLLDEPFAALDRWLAEKLSGLLHLLQRRFGLTIIIVTHYPNEAMSLADRVGVLGGSHLLQTGKPEEVHDRPGHRTVAFLFGQPNINFIHGCVTQRTFTATPGNVQLPVSLPPGDFSLGIHPRDLSATPTPSAMSFGEFTPTQHRRYGPGWLIHCERDGLRLHWYTTTPRNMQRTERITLWVSPDQCHWFDEPTGWRREPD